jgi:hypothetical protein
MFPSSLLSCTAAFYPLFLYHLQPSSVSPFS